MTGSQASIVVSICALAVSIISLGTSIYFSWCARDHNRRSVKPLPFIRQFDFEDQIGVSILNNGSGPLILNKAEAIAANGRRGHLIDLIPEAPPGIFFSNFNKVEQVRALRPGDELPLLDLEPDVESSSERAYRDHLREALGQITIALSYPDIYDTCFPGYSIALTWFNRDRPKSS